MLTGLIFILRMTICQMTKLFHRNKDLYLLFSPRLSLIVCCCFFLRCVEAFFGMFLKCFWQFCYAKFHSWCDLQSLNQEYTGKSTVCLPSGLYRRSQEGQGARHPIEMSQRIKK